MIKPLTSLRFVFALFVFLHHFTIGGRAIFPEGYIGVSFFFILSGFIISYNYKQKIIEKTISIRKFIIARIARIYPLHLLTLLFALILAKSFPWKNFLFNLTLLQSYIPIKDVYFSFNAVSWSISTELFFYAMFPVLIIIFTKIKRKWLLIICLVIFCAYFTSLFIFPKQYHHAIFYINPIVRVIDFTIGIGFFYLREYMQLVRIRSRKIIFFTARKNIATIIEILSICILIAMIMLSKYIPQVYRYGSYYWVPMSIIILCFAFSFTNVKSYEGGYISRILSVKPLVIAGEISFGFYMLHSQIINVGNHILTRISGKFSIAIPDVFKCLIIFMCVLLASVLSFYCFEKPANKFVKKVLGRL